LAGLVSCVGACLADSVYVVAVQVGMEQVAQFIHRQTLCLHILAAVFIVTVGSRIIVRSPKFRDEGRDHHKGLLSSAFLLSVTNPVMLISLPALFTAMQFRPDPINPMTTTISAACVFVGSMLWWSTITYWLDRSSNRLSDQVVRKASTMAGLVLILLGFASLSSLFR